jgi:hypothetical protein
MNRDEFLAELKSRKDHLSQLTKELKSAELALEKFRNHWKTWHLAFQEGDCVRVVQSESGKSRLGFVTFVDVDTEPVEYWILWANKDGSKPKKSIIHRYKVFEGSPNERLELEYPRNVALLTVANDQ